MDLAFLCLSRLSGQIWIRSLKISPDLDPDLWPPRSGRCGTRENAAQQAALSLLHKLEAADSLALTGRVPSGPPAACPARPECSGGVILAARQQEDSDPSHAGRRAQEGTLATASFSLLRTRQMSDDDGPGVLASDDTARESPSRSDEVPTGLSALIAQGNVTFLVSLDVIKIQLAWRIPESPLESFVCDAQTSCVAQCDTSR